MPCSDEGFQVGKNMQESFCSSENRIPVNNAEQKINALICQEKIAELFAVTFIPQRNTKQRDCSGLMIGTA